MTHRATSKMRVDAKRVLADSLVELSKKRHLDKITVRDIVANCGASRQTFYNHFSDKYDLIKWIYKSQLDEVTRTFNSGESLGRVCCGVLEFMKEDETFYSSAFRIQGQDSFSEFLHKCTCDFYTEQVERRLSGLKALTPALAFAIEFNSYAAVSAVRRWVENGMTEPPEQVTVRILHNMPPDLKRWFVTETGLDDDSQLWR